MTKTIKEIIILLLICLILMLAFAIILYDYIPNRKTVKQVTEHATSQEVQTLLEDNIDSSDKEVVKTYEVTSSDLTNYSIRKEYVKGKDNPFASIEAHENEKNKNSTTGQSSTGNTTSATTSNESTSQSGSSTETTDTEQQEESESIK